MSHYQPPAGMYPTKNSQSGSNVQVVNQPNSYQVNTSNYSQGQTHSYQSGYVDSKAKEGGSALDRIDQQLEESRKMFPSWLKSDVYSLIIILI